MLPKEVEHEYVPFERKKREKKDKTPQQALASLMRLCARAEKAESDALRLMRGWGVKPDDARQVLEQLKRERFIDNRRYAETFVREKLRLSGWGEYKIRTALQRKQIDRELIDSVLAETDRSGMGERLKSKLATRLRTVKYKTPYDLKSKLLRYALSLGYDYETALDTVDQILKESNKATEICEEF